MNVNKDKEEVISWFSPLEVFVANPRVASHIESLTKYYNNPVATTQSTWKRLYTDCLTDIGRNPKNLDILEDMSKKFIKESGKNEKELNEMTKEDFVKLFAKTMDKIIKDEEKESIETYCQDKPHFCKVVDGVLMRMTAGKSKKKSRKRNASKRRNRRTRNYKKK